MIRRKLTYTAKFSGTVEENLKQYGFSTRICIQLKSRLGLVKVDGLDKFVVDYVNEGDVIELIIEESASERITPFDFPLDIIYQDEDVAVIDKPPNIAVISTSAHYNKSLMNALAAIWGDFIYHPVTRLDKGTSGLMLIAKHSLSHSLLNAVIADETSGERVEKAVKREYVCLVNSSIPDKGVIDAPIAHTDKTCYRRTIDYDCGKRALTEYECLDRYGDIALVRIKLYTGRTHQIRVHMSYIGCPLVGDELYGGDVTEIDRPALHSKRLEFTHPITQEYMVFESSLPLDIRSVIERRSV